jgi:hypothetical protein
VNRIDRSFALLRLATYRYELRGGDEIVATGIRSESRNRHRPSAGATATKGC